MIHISTVRGKSMLDSFIDFPHDLYSGDSNYVPELFISQKELLTPKKNPFFQHAKMELFLATRNDRIVGRIAAIINDNHNAFVGRREGFFGFFDCINDPEVAAKLLETAAGYLRDNNIGTMLGPVNPSTNDPCGTLVNGFDGPPVAMMPYNAAYYDALITESGLVKWTDLLAYIIKREELSGRVVALRDLLLHRLEKNGITIRPIRMKDFKSETDQIKAVYNSAWDKNLGFVPMTDAEFNRLAAELKLIINPEACLVAEKDGKLVAWLLGIPDINQILIKIKKGRLFPTGLFKLLTGRKNITTVRVLTLGVLEPYRKLGIESALYTTLIKNLENTKIDTAECSWLLEDNHAITSAVEKLNAKPYRRYRLYRKEL
ncbi:GNAT family N-acetyltransferase [Ravibacter arvi]|uniref:GNAT family N-acetyltransferase n=1 Tax=Ravibacter arvi TaxID=2051041 RepID=A0ABP8M464_9BACT